LVKVNYNNRKKKYQNNKTNHNTFQKNKTFYMLTNTQYQ